MAKKAKKFSVQSYDNKHYRMTEQYTKAVDRLFDSATTSIAEAAANGKYDPDKPFNFDDYPKVKTAMQEVTSQLASRMQVTIETGSRAEWLAACDKNDAFLNSIMDTSKLSKSTLSKMTDQNLDALSAFQQRKVDGMDLSTRVWNYVGQYRDQVEQALDVGLGEGRSAQQLARDVKKNLKEPNRLFRRVRDKRGNLVLSKNARAFHPGQGVYRSSVKNAQRLTRSEINMAYRTSDYERWQRLDFIVGFEILRSNHEPLCKCSLCEQLKGRYPKEFKFVGWHPQCMCYAIPVMMDEQTIDENEAGDLKAALFGTKYEHKAGRNGITDVPKGFKDWMKENASKQKDWASSPYFVRDNFKNGKIADGLSITPTPSPIAKVQPVKVDPKEQELQSLITQAQKVLAEAKNKWGIVHPDVDFLEDFIEEGNATFIKAAMDRVQNLVIRRESALNDYMQKARLQVSKAQAKGIDASAVLADIDMAESNPKVWYDQRIAFEERVTQLYEAVKGTVLDDFVERAANRNIDYLEVQNLEKTLSFDEIVERLGGADRTKGSCASLAYAYAGNKAGLDVLDFRDGESRKYFSTSGSGIYTGKKLGIVESDTNDFKAVDKLFSQMEEGKEYILSTGRHASVVRIVDGKREYLELQGNNNGWKKWKETTLLNRFKCKKYHGRTRYAVDSTIIDIEKLAKDKRFRELLGYINTKVNAQHKGAGGGLK